MPELEAQTVVPYLRTRGLVPATVRDEDLTVRDRSSAHLNYAVATRGEDNPAGWFVKQGLGVAGRRALAVESAAYRELEAAGKAAGPGALSPALLHHDVERDVLVVELLGSGVDLREYRLRGSGFESLVGQAVGEVLADLHGLPAPVIDQSGGPWASRAPWVLHAHRPRPATLRHVSPADVEVIKLLQGSVPMREGLERLRLVWRQDGFIHGDLRWENCIVAPDPGSYSGVTVRLVDWERASPGDPCFDLGAAAAEYLRSWLSSVAEGSPADLEHVVRSADAPFEAMTPELRSMWQAYAHRRQLDATARRNTLARFLPFVAVRLIVSAFEQTQDNERLTSEVVLTLQAAENLFAWPWQAIARTLALDP